MIKAVAIDIDGTLTDEKRRIDLEAVRLVREIESKKIPVILATGNILCFAEAASIFIGTSGPLVAENGGIIKTIYPEKFYYKGDIRKANKAFSHVEKQFDVRKVSRSDLRKTEIAIYRDIEVSKIKECVKDFDVDIVDTKFAIHFKDPEVNKGRALKEVAKLMNIDLEDIVAIGDSENDYEMLEHAGIGISVGEKKLKEVSDYMTKNGYGKGGREALNYVLSNLFSIK
ncbi:MAG: phosphoglycolate phosphatase [Candidatus Hydrothermarchaeales archaeon]